MNKILVLSPKTNVKGGISTVINNYVQNGLYNNYEVFFVHSHSDGTKFRKLIQALIGLLTLILTLTRNKIDIVHIHGSDVISSLRKYFFLKVIEKFGCKVIYHFHGASFLNQYPNKNNWWKGKIKYLFEKANLVICLSENWSDSIKQIAPYAKTTVIENAVCLPSNYQKCHIEDEKQIHLLFLGRIGQRKGVFDLLKVIQKLKQKGCNLKLSIGGNGAVDDLKKEILALDIGEVVSFRGWVGDIEKTELFKEADIYILPSYGEGMPMSILEAMSYGLPVISTKVGGIPDLITQNETGFLINPGDLDDMSDKIERLIKSPELRVQMGENARRKIDKNYNLSANIVKINRIYQELITSEHL